jgi:dTDP-4-amino-4,6-dideoxygalactose transaminase
MLRGAVYREPTRKFTINSSDESSFSLYFKDVLKKIVLKLGLGSCLALLESERMFPRIFARKCIDITWNDLWTFTWRYILRLETVPQVETDIEKLWSPKGTLVAFTVQSRFDLCLQVSAFPPRSEVIVSAVTIPDMVRIIEYHKLVPVPVDIQEDGSVLADDIDALITSKTRAILIAHLFGNRMPFNEISNIAKRKGIFVFEDCAEAFCGREFTGHPNADVSMFSFGLIKTSTAFGRALLTIRDPALLDSIRSIHSLYPA